MGIYIPNMNKPENCMDCIVEEYADCDICKGLVSASKYADRRYEHCPIIEIIPCKECKNSHMTYGGQCKYCDLERDDDDNFIECYFDGDHFCSYGARK